MTDPSEDDTARVPRPGRNDAGDDGSTVVARRESRRRQERADAARVSGDRVGGAAGGPATALDPDRIAESGISESSGRVARPPDATPAVSAVRTAGPVVVPRGSPAPRAPQSVVDTAAEESSRRRRSRRMVAIVTAAASVVIVLAAVALIFLVIG